MKLNYEGRQKLRKEVEKKLSLVPEGERIKLPKETLEELLFEVDIVKLEHLTKTCKVKYLVWSGEFLRKVDLSEVSFDNIDWHANNCQGIGNHMSTHKGYLQYGVDKINLSGTNAKIDFKKSFDALYCEQIMIINCDFSGVDLSNNVLDVNCFEIFEIGNCNFDDTKIKFCSDINSESYPRCFFLINSSFKNVDFSNFTIMADYLEQGEDYDIRDSDFYNSGLNICFDKKPNSEMLDFIKKHQLTFEKIGFNPYKDFFDYSLEEKMRDSEYEEISNFYEKLVGSFDEFIQFNSYLNKGYLQGCYINGKRIPTKEEREATKAQLLGEYQQFEEQEISSVLGEIDTAIKAIRK